MQKHGEVDLYAFVILDRNATIPMHQQLSSQIGRAVLSGRLPSGTKLPPSRNLAKKLKVSRTTVVTAFQQLIGEGYLESRVGVGTFVGSHLQKLDLPSSLLQRNGRTSVSSPIYNVLSDRGKALVKSKNYNLLQVPTTFLPNQPAYDKFPFDVWARLMWRQHRNPSYELLNYGNTMGYPPLRRAIAGYLDHARGIKCDENQIVIVSGSQMAVSLTAWILLNPGDSIMVEDPGYMTMRGMLKGFGARIVHVPVDDQGMKISSGIEMDPNARIALLAPSHQYPLSVTLSLTRRIELLSWASRANSWIVEDDYDSEFRFSGAPLAPMQTIDPNGRVIYVGTFSKALYPSLRIGYLVVPPALIDAYGSAVHFFTRGVSTLTQAVLAEFIERGHFTKHIRRMRSVYAERHEEIIDAIHRELNGVIDLSPAKAGMNVIGWLSQHATDHDNDVSAAQKLKTQGVLSTPMSILYSKKQPRHGLLLGFGNSSSEEIQSAVIKMAQVLD